MEMVCKGEIGEKACPMKVVLIVVSVAVLFCRRGGSCQRSVVDPIQDALLSPL